ncbi:nuclear transport factor 2 family protein [Rhodocaloribacter sp.]
MTEAGFEAWLVAYGGAWEARDAEAFAALFTEDVRYHWMPFEAPKEGREGVAAAFRAAVARQSDIRFGFEIWRVTPEHAVAHWWCRFTRLSAGHPVRLDGVLTMEAAPDGRCRIFREWWHSDEHSA